MDVEPRACQIKGVSEVPIVDDQVVEVESENIGPALGLSLSSDLGPPE